MRDQRLNLPCTNLTPRFIGPFVVVTLFHWTRCINPVAYQVAIPRTLRISPVFQVSHLRKAHSSPLQPPRPCHRLRGNIWWNGRATDRSWVPQRDILDPALLLDFHDRHSDLPGPSGAGPRRGGFHTSSPPESTRPARETATRKRK
uniref:Tf2-1-like SH3-like domain-containing protein n=1 Tax=Denticeps clupeoides TaxID=299321 RepID=A0AAY4BT56_9TELE